MELDQITASLHIRISQQRSCVRVCRDSLSDLHCIKGWWSKARAPFVPENSLSGPKCLTAEIPMGKPVIKACSKMFLMISLRGKSVFAVPVNGVGGSIPLPARPRFSSEKRTFFTSKIARVCKPRKRKKRKVRQCRLEVRFGETPKPARETRELPEQFNC